MSRQWCGRASQGAGTRLPVREVHQLPLSAWAAASRGSQLPARLPLLGDAGCIQFDEFTMNAANLVGSPILRHEERHLVPLVEIIEIHEMLRLRKREHVQSLSRASLRQLNSRDDFPYQKVIIPPNINIIFPACLQLFE